MNNSSRSLATIDESRSFKRQLGKSSYAGYVRIVAQHASTLSATGSQIRLTLNVPDQYVGIATRIFVQLLSRVHAVTSGSIQVLEVEYRPDGAVLPEEAFLRELFDLLDQKRRRSHRD